MNSLFDRFSQKVLGSGREVTWKPRVRREFTRQIIKTTSWDEFDWKTVRRDKDIDKAITDLYQGDLKNPDERPGYLNAPELIQDIFMTFLKPVPVKHKKIEVKRDARLNGKFVEQLMALTDYERLHDQTLTDVMLSKMATGVVIEALQGMIKQHRDAVKQANEDRQNSDDPDPNGPPGTGGESWDEETGSGKRRGGKGGKGGSNGGNQPAGHNADEGGESQVGDDEPGEPSLDADENDESQQLPWEDEREMRERIKQELEEARKREAEAGAGAGEFEGETGEDEEAAEDEEGEGLDELEREFAEDWLEREYDEESNWEKMFDNVDFGRHVNSALQQAAEKIEELENARKGVGIEDEEWKLMDPTARLRIAEQLNTPRMKKIAEMVGRMKRFALSKQQTKIIDAPHEIYDVEMGNDIRRVMRSEFAYLGHPGTKIEFYRKFANGELLQYKERGHEDVGKGPMIVCVDDQTEIMTITGWKRHSEVQIGDQVLTLNHATGLSEWHPVTKLHVLPDEERTMLRIQGKRHDSLTTLDHRWPVLASHGRENGKRRPRRREWKMSQELTSEDQLVTAAANANLPTQAKYRDSLVELVAWTWTDGSVNLNSEPLVKIFQSHRVYPLFTDRIRTALTDLFGPESSGDLRSMRDGTPRWRATVDEKIGSTVFSLNKHASEEIRAHMSVDRVVDKDFILSLTEGQLALFYATSIDGDGSAKGNVPLFQQAEGERREVFEMVCALAGVQTTSDDKSVRLMSKQHLSLSGYDMERVQHQGIVWCVTVENSSWLARRNGKVYYTGNCIDNSGSMYGAPENWAKGVAEAMRRVCADQRRDFHAIYFETNRHRERFDFPMGQGPFEKVLTFLSVTAGGGTEFDGVLTEALNKCQTMFDNSGKGKADIVFITDGQANLNPQWVEKFVEQRDAIGARIFGIYISASDSQRSTAVKVLKSFCQMVVPVKALEVNDEASATLFEIL